MKVLVTGGSGIVGHYVIDELLRNEDFFFLIIFYSSCKKEDYIPQSLSDGKYFPMKLGNWIIYEVDSVFYDDFYVDFLFL